MEQQKRNHVKLYIWLMFGILCSFAIGMMKTSGTFNTERFFDQGEVYEFSPETFMKSTTYWYYDRNAGMYVMQNHLGARMLPAIEMYRKWNYISLNVGNLNRESSEFIFAFYDKAGNMVWKQSNIIGNGDNLIPIQYAGKFKKVKVIIRNQPGITLTVNSMQLKDTDTGFLFSVFFQYFATAAIVYILLTLLAVLILHIRVKDRNWYAPVEILQYAYMLFGNYLGEKWTRGLDKKVRSRIRKELFWFLFLYTMIYQISGFYMEKQSYKEGILMSVAVLVLIAIFSWEKPLQYVRWKGLLPISWLILWTMVCISDFAVSKYFKFTGYVFLFGVGFFFFIWNQMEQPKQIRNDMIRGLEWTFPVVVVWCMFFRQKIDGIFYNGIYANREDMALYALMMLVVFLAEIFYYLCYSRSHVKERWIGVYIVGTVLSIWFLWQTQVRSALIAGGVVLVLFFYMLKKEEKICKKSVFAISAVCSILAVLVIQFSTENLPEMLGTNHIYKNDRYDVVYETLSQEEIDERIMKKTRSVTAVHKKAIWKHYVRKLNLLGNKNRLIVYEKYTMAQNGMLEMAYRYGIFILIPYIGLLLLCLYHAVHEGGFLMLATTLAFGITMLTQNIEQPFAHTLWIVFYLGMGIWFVEEDGDKKESRLEKRILRLVNKKER